MYIACMVTSIEDLTDPPVVADTIAIKGTNDINVANNRQYEYNLILHIDDVIKLGLNTLLIVLCLHYILFGFKFVIFSIQQKRNPFETQVFSVIQI